MSEQFRASSDSQTSNANQGRTFLAALQNLTGMDQVAAVIESRLSSESEHISSIASKLFEIGGKRLRPALALLVARAFSLTPPPQPLLDIAAGIELIHMATLLHDDLIDRSPLRRGRPTALATHGFAQTLLAGDFLLVRAFALCAHLDRVIIEATEQACIQLTEGESIETPMINAAPSVEDYLEVARKKTAALFSLAAFSAAHLTGLSEGDSRKIGQFGEFLGISFQILDDILDVTAEEEKLGKQPGSDIKERKPSLVNILWLQSGDPLAKRLIEVGREPDTTYIEQALRRLRETGDVLTQCRQLAYNYASQARRCLKEVADHNQELVQPDGLSLIYNLIDYTLARLE